MNKNINSKINKQYALLLIKEIGSFIESTIFYICCCTCLYMIIGYDGANKCICIILSIFLILLSKQLVTNTNYSIVKTKSNINKLEKQLIHEQTTKLINELNNIRKKSKEICTNINHILDKSQKNKK